MSYFGFHQYENFAANILAHKLLSSKCVLFENNVLPSDTVPLSRSPIKNKNIRKKTVPVSTPPLKKLYMMPLRYFPANEKEC